MEQNQTKSMGSKNLTSVQKREPTKRGLKFKPNGNGTCKLVGTGLFLEKEVLIPVMHEGMRVTEIEKDAFKGCRHLKSIIVPNSVTNIGEGAFSGCSGLTSITIPFVGKSKNTRSASEISVLGYIFGKSNYAGGNQTRQFYALARYADYCIPQALTSVTVTDGEILSGAFWGCKNLKNIVIGNGVTNIASKAFSSCQNLTRVIIVNGITNIGYDMFFGCESLTNITIPESVTHIGDSAFNGCKRLSVIRYNGTIEQWNAIQKGIDWNDRVPAREILCFDGSISVNAW